MDIFKLLTPIKRPKILIRAAVYALSDYRRERDLRRLTKAVKTPTPRKAFEGLLAQEDRLECARTKGDAAYNAHRHIRVLTALLAEARLIPSLKRKQI